MKIVNYLDVSLILNNSNYKPYHKLDNKILYIHKDSNHPPNILNKSPHRLKNEFSPYPTKLYLKNQKKYAKKL